MCVSKPDQQSRPLLLIYTVATTTIDIVLDDPNRGLSFITDGHGFRSLFTESMNLWQSFLYVEITGLLLSENGEV